MQFPVYFPPDGYRRYHARILPLPRPVYCRCFPPGRISPPRTSDAYIAVPSPQYISPFCRSARFSASDTPSQAIRLPFPHSAHTRILPVSAGYSSISLDIPPLSVPALLYRTASRVHNAKSKFSCSGYFPIIILFIRSSCFRLNALPLPDLFPRFSTFIKNQKTTAYGRGYVLMVIP
jgi:hypothetical protein